MITMYEHLSALDTISLAHYHLNHIHIPHHPPYLYISHLFIYTESHTHHSRLQSVWTDVDLIYHPLPI